MVNAAPFSFFNVFCEDPPLCMFAVNRRPDGRVKDTLVNIERTGEFVVNLTDEPLARAMHEISGDFPPEIGEPDLSRPEAGALDQGRACPASPTRPGRWSARPGRPSTSTATGVLIMGEGINFHIRDELWDHDAMRVHMERYHPIGRMFADRYCRTDDRVVFPPAQGAA